MLCSSSEANARKKVKRGSRRNLFVASQSSSEVDLVGGCERKDVIVIAAALTK